VRRPETTEAERKASGAFVTLSPYRDGNIFCAKFSGDAAWERHPSGDELVRWTLPRTSGCSKADDEDRPAKPCRCSVLERLRGPGTRIAPCQDEAYVAQVDVRGRALRRPFVMISSIVFWPRQSRRLQHGSTAGSMFGVRRYPPSRRPRHGCAQS
jgi:hypothetical protein